MDTLSVKKNGVIQPWGLLNSGYSQEAADKTPPSDWLAPGPKLTRKSHFDSWFKHTLALINEHLWPRYDPIQHEWIGSSISTMQSLTDLDLDVMLAIQAGSEGVKRFEEPIRTTLSAPDWTTQKELYVSEDADGGSGAFSNAHFYDRTLDKDKLAILSHLCFQAGARKMGTINSRMKGLLQRPRPMHQALLTGRVKFTYEEALSSVTPSMCSGHCLTGVMFVAAAIERLIEDDAAPGFTPQALATWGVSIGDRRVLAGVHYPSDNLCSWILFLSSASFVYRSCEAVKHMAEAISQSYILQQMRSKSGASGAKEYRVALQVLDDLLEKALTGLISEKSRAAAVELMLGASA